MVDFYINLVMYSLRSCYALVDCRFRIIWIQFSNDPALGWKGSSSALIGRLISYLKTKDIISKGYIYHLIRFKYSNSETSLL